MAEELIGRICLFRSLPENIIASQKLNVKVLICGEFRDPIIGSLESCRFFYAWLPHLRVEDDSISTSRHAVECKIKADMCNITVVAPETTGNFYLFIGSDCERHVLPFISDRIIVNDPIQGSLQSGIMLRNYRYISLPVNHLKSNSIMVMEEYGYALGSHVYDSSVILIEYFNCLVYNDDADKETLHTCVELGAGCGPVGLWLGKSGIFQHLVLTDKPDVVPIIDQNIGLNGLHDICEARTLRWENATDIDSLMESYRNIDCIIGADVFYDAAAAKSMLSLITHLFAAEKGCTPKKFALLAQKHRELIPSTSSTINLSEIAPFLVSTLVFSKSSVSIWRLELAEST